MKKLLYIIAFATVSLVGCTRANVESLNVAPATQSAISGSLVTLTITGTNTTGDTYMKYVLPKTMAYDVVYQNANVTPINNSSLMTISTEHDPVFFIAADTSFSITITAKVTSNNREFPTLNTQANFATDMQISNVLTSAVAQITPIADLVVTNILTGENPMVLGDNVSYFVTIKNIGSTAAAGFTFVSTFPITTLGAPNATFNGTAHPYSYLNYPQDFVWSGNYLSSLYAGDSITILLNGALLQNFAVGTPFSQIAKVSSISPEYTTGNNSATATGAVQTVADVWVTKTLAPFTGFQSGDIVTYTITYGNSGGQTATFVNILDSMNGEIAFNEPAYIAAAASSTGEVVEFVLKSIGSLPAGSGGTWILTGTLTSTLSSGATFANKATIETKSIEVTTGNNSSTVVHTVIGRDDITLQITANNLTRPQLDNAPYGSGSDVMIQAAQGDIVQFTMTYSNRGNTVGTHATLKLNGIDTFITTTPFMSTLNVIQINTTQTVIVTGTIGPRNYISFTPTATLTHDIGQTVTDSVRIVEPMVCGDGLLTRNEVCDTQGNLGVLFGGQVCENQQGVCVLVTQSIVNNACVDYQYTNPLGGLTTGQSCSSVDVALSAATCNVMTGSAPVETTNGYDINYTCRGNNTTATTPISIACGNGTTIVGSGSTFNGTCSYASSFVGNAQCIVGSDVASTACRLPVNENQFQCDLEALDGRIILVDDNGEGEGRFRCETRDGATAQTISIDCGNRAIDGDASATNTSQIETICEYDENTLPEDAIVTCSTNDVICETENIIIDEGTFGRCGDNERQGYEDCDGTDTPAGQTCTANCDIAGAAPVACFSISNANLSVQENEYLPYWRVVEGDKNAVTSCTEDTVNKVRKDSLKCTFEIINKDGVAKTIDTACKNTNTSTIFNYFSKLVGTSFANAYGKYTTLIDSDITEDNYGEYKVRLAEVNYDYCDGDEFVEGTPIKRVCETNFTVTKPYLIQKSSFGITPKATNNIDLENFFGIDGTKLITSTKMDEIMVLDAQEYEGGNKIQTMMDAFITKYEKIAIKYTTVKSEEGNDIIAYKVPSQDIVIFKGNGTLNYTDGTKKTKPFTVIVDGPSLKINGSIANTNAMFLVNKGDITIEPSTDACAKTQVVKGIFVTKKSFLGGKDLNNDATTAEWCSYGGLTVQGIMIGNDIENLVQSRRSQLNHWFTVGGNNEASINAERRNEIFKGASVLIEYSPSLRSALPPGASEFTKALDVYKQ